MRKLVYRYVWFTIGVIINSFGVAIITKAALGTSPISSVPYVLSLEFPWSLGQFTFVMNLFFIAAQVVLRGRKFPPIQLLQIVVNLVFSAFIDVGMKALWWFEPSSLPVKLVALVLGCAVLGCGISIEVAPDALLVPGEGVVGAITDRTGKRFGSVKIVFDVTLVIIALILSFIFFRGINGLGLGTIVSALIVGRFVNLFNAHFPLIARIRMLRAVMVPEQEMAAADSAAEQMENEVQK